MTTVAETTDRCDVSKVKVGSVWTRHDSGKVVDIRGNNIDVKNDKGDTWQISANLVASQFSFADQSDEGIQINRTEMIALLKKHTQTAMTVTYHKKPDPKAIAKALADGQGGMTTRQWNKVVKDLVSGEERTMIGHHYGVMDTHDRLQFREHGKGHRLIDTRTITRLTVNRINYTLRK